jgi:uncharacterized phage infection (PIP) family protein YhgE
MTTQIHLNVNDLVEQIVNLTNQNNKALSEAKEFSEKLQDVERELLGYQEKEIKARQELENDLDELAAQNSVSTVENLFSKISNG